MNTFQQLLGKLEKEHSSQLQNKDLMIRDLTNQLKTEIKVLTSRKSRKTALDSSPSDPSPPDRSHRKASQWMK
jgi:hypothetical protein